jgi:nucleoside permease NupC
MRAQRLAKFLALPLLVTLFLSLLSPVAVFAHDAGILTAHNPIAQEGDDHAEEEDTTHDDEDTAHSEEAVVTAAVGEGNIGLGVALGIIFLVLALIAIVAVIGGVSLGVIGLGYWQSEAGGD